MSKAPQRPTNQLLAALPDCEYQRLAPQLEHVSLCHQQVIHQPDEPLKAAYFPEEGIISLVSILEDGSTNEIGMVGDEGMAGISIFLGGNSIATHASVQIPGTALRMNADLLKTEFNRGGELQKLLLLYTQALFTQVSQTVACNAHHTVEQRLARWLLLVSHFLQSDQLPLTQEFLGQMLGVRRSSVTVAAGILSQAGIIRYTRGQITILRRQDLEVTTCECYSLVVREYGRLLGQRQVCSSR